jgi:hypothetical protein
VVNGSQVDVVISDYGWDSESYTAKSACNDSVTPNQILGRVTASNQSEAVGQSFYAIYEMDVSTYTGRLSGMKPGATTFPTTFTAGNGQRLFVFGSVNAGTGGVGGGSGLGGSPGKGGSSGAGGTTTVAPTSGTGGKTGAGGTFNTGGTTATVGSCPSGAVKVPASGKMTDFSDFRGQDSQGRFGVNPADGTQVNASWGAGGLTGGTFFYQQENADGVQATIANNALVLSASLAAYHYAGIGLYFTSNCGYDACAFKGISLSALGDSGGAAVDLQLQMRPDYPIDSTGRGTCDYVHADAAEWSYCNNPHVTEAAGASDASQTLQFPWSGFAGGSPRSTVDCSQLLGIQVQFDCGATACTPNITIDDLQFFN